MRPRCIVGLSLVLLAVSLVGVEVYGKLKFSRPIKIDFEERPLRRIDQGDVYTLKMSWRNLDRRSSYEGSFIFIAKAKAVKTGHMTFTFEDSTITPAESKNTLTFTLPTMTFPPGASGIITVEIVYSRAGVYAWEIGVTRLF
jgi:hypothetical protein